ncbi:hypothetical protein LguiB_006939 [Lonicera macranthoides]
MNEITSNEVVKKQVSCLFWINISFNLLFNLLINFVSLNLSIYTSLTPHYDFYTSITTLPTIIFVILLKFRIFRGNEDEDEFKRGTLFAWNGRAF